MGAISRLPGDEKGNFLVFFGLSVAVLLGTVALSFDLGRLAATQTELQSFADSVALAAAAELDGGATSVTRARDAAARLITDRQTFATGGRALNSADFDLTFLSALPPNDSLPDPPGNVVCRNTGCNGLSAANAARAILVRVDVDPHSMPFSFASVLNVVGADSPDRGQVQATATAGFTQFACDIAPLFFCAPPTGVQAGQMVRLRTGGGGGGGGGFWEPGNFGFLDISSENVDPSGPCAGLNSSQLTRCLLGATQRITACYSIRGVSTDTGQRVGITTDPFNFRFDMYANNARNGPNPEFRNPLFAPAPNTIRGQDPEMRGPNPEWCQPVTAANSIGLPRGDEFTNPNTRFGGVNTFTDTSANRLAYVARNYNGTDPFIGEGIRTRWQYYNREISRIATLGRILPATLANGTTPRLETGIKQCAETPASTDPERRVLVAASVDCAANEIRGQTDNVQVQQFWRVFLTEPVGDIGPASGSDKEIFGELIDNVGGTGSTTAGIFHDVVQLYR